MDIESFYLLLSFVCDALQVDEAKVASCGRMIIPELCLCCTLCYLVGASYLDVIVFACISTSSFYRIVHKTIHAINLMDELSINFPQTMAKCRAAAARFANISFQSAIANCIGALDGYLVAINTPPSLVVGNARSYFSGHYQHYGVNVQARCDHLCHFTYFAFASVNDCDAIKETSLPLLIRNVPAGFIIIGDTVYEASEKIVSLFYGVDALVLENDNFNFYGSQCCICIEMAFGMMSQKWGILKCPLSGNMQFTTNIAICVAHLHNFTINKRLKKEMQQSEQDTIDLLFQDHNCNITGTDQSNWSVDGITTTMPMDQNGVPVTTFGEEDFTGAPGISAVRSEMVCRIASKKLVCPVGNEINRTND